MKILDPWISLKTLPILLLSLLALIIVKKAEDSLGFPSFGNSWSFFLYITSLVISLGRTSVLMFLYQFFSESEDAFYPAHLRIL